MRDLLERVKAATGPDRELDTEIVIGVTPKASPGILRGTYELEDQPHLLLRAPDITASLDEALAFVARVMKPKLLEISGGWNPSNPAEWPAWTVRWYPPHVPKDGKSWWAQVETAPTPALALLATFLSALVYEQQHAPTAA